MSSRLLAHAGRQPHRFPPRACTRHLLTHMPRQAPHAVFAPDGRSPEPPPHIAAKLAANIAAMCSAPACRCALCGLSVNPASLIVRSPQRQAARGPVFARWATPRHGAPECRVELRPTHHRATSHNGARYAFVRSKTPSHVALSGAPPRCLQAEKSGSGCRHTFRPSGNPSGWNRSVLFPWRCCW